VFTDSVDQLFATAAQGASCIDTVEEWVGQYLFLNNVVTLTTIPIYHL
jgi:hypothetical protein